MFGLPGEIVIFICWVGLFFIFTGIGLLIQRAWGLKLYDAETLLLCFWLGWAISIGVLQFWHFWWKIDGWAFLLVSLIGVTGLIWNAPQLRQVTTTITRQQWFPLLLMVIIGLWLANRTTAWVIRPEFDTGLYHMTTMKWMASYPIVPGLGNLYGPLAINNSYFLYAAMLDVGPWNDRAIYLSNGLLLYVLLIQGFVSLLKLSANDNYRAYHLYHSLLLVPTIPAAFGINWILGLSPSNLSPDVAVFALGIVLFGRMLVFFIDSRGEGAEHTAEYKVFCIIILTCFAVTVKLSLIFLAGMVLLLILTLDIVRNRLQWKRKIVKTLPMLGICGGFFLLPWLIRNIILTGYIFYPGTTALFPLDWQMPHAVVVYERNLIVAWSRRPDWNSSWIESIGNSDWLQPWLDTLPDYVTMPLELTLLALVCLVACRGIMRGANILVRVQWLLLLPPALAIIFWFVLSPNPRYAGATFWILAVVALMLAVERFVHRFQLERFAVALCYGFFIAVFLYVKPLRNPLWIAPIKQNENGLSPVHAADYETISTNSGLEVHVPKNQPACWNAPLPCTPFFRPDLRLRESGKVEKGFIMEKDRVFLDTPEGVTASSDLDFGLLVGWYAYQTDEQVRWMNSPAYIVIYTQQTMVAKLSLTPAEMNIGNAFGEVSQLKVTVNYDREIDIPFKKDVRNEILLPLHRDFNIIQLESAAGNFIPSEVIPGNNDTRSLSIAFSSIEVTTLD